MQQVDVDEKLMESLACEIEECWSLRESKNPSPASWLKIRDNLYQSKESLRVRAIISWKDGKVF